MGEEAKKEGGRHPGSAYRGNGRKGGWSPQGSPLLKKGSKKCDVQSAEKKKELGEQVMRVAGGSYKRKRKGGRKKRGLWDKQK